MKSLFNNNTIIAIAGEISARKILVIESDSGAARLAEYTLDMAGYNVVVAHDGSEGLAKAMNEHPDLIILDVNVPVINGYEICRRLWSNHESAVTPILVITSKTPEKRCVVRKIIGAENYLVKPVEPEEMLDRVTSLLSDFYNIRHSTDTVSGRQHADICEAVHA